MAEETTKLVNVLRRISRAAGYAAYNREAPDAARFCAHQYNKVLARLCELEPAVRPLFTALPENASPDVTRMAARELAAYFEDDAESWPKVYAFRCGERSRRARRRAAIFCNG